MKEGSHLSNINRRIIELWDKESKNSKFSEYLTRVPQFFLPPLDLLYKESFLFVGINPSFSEKGFINISKNMGQADKYFWLKDGKKVKGFYSWQKDKITNDYLKQLDEIDRLFVEHHFYFTKVKKIANDCKLNLLITDLFCMRETSQKNTKKTIFKNGRDGELTDFAEQQVKIFLDIVRVSRPRIILVGNALASDIIIRYLKPDPKFNNDFGTYLWRIGDNEIPIFFSGMLSGQRALDNHSMKRLEWQIKHL
jgi:hypothetical protein